MDVKTAREEQKDREDLIEGRNAVQEAIRAGRPIDKIYAAKGETDRRLARLLAAARDEGITVVECDRRKLDTMSATGAHQGIVAVAAVRGYCDIDDILALARERGEDPFVILCDEITDPYNLGAILRTAECAGAHGVIVPRRRSAGLTAAVDKASAGAAEHIPVARVNNVSDAIRRLKEAGLWVYGTSVKGENSLWTTDMTGPACLVVGSEGSGMSRLVEESCDVLVRIPMNGKLNSLNASVAAGVAVYEILRQRGKGN